MKQLIITADDLGLTKGVNEGIVMALKEGVLTYVSVLPSGDAFQDALEKIRALGLKEIGAHLALTEISPASDPFRIPSLVVKGDYFNKSRVSFFGKFFLGLINREEVYLELKAQLDTLKKTGIPITCISSHEHIHMMPQILEIFLNLAKEYDIPYIRYMNDKSRIEGFRPAKNFRAIIQSIFRANMKKRLDRALVKHADRLLGFIDSGDIDEANLLALISNVGDGTTELVIHPGFMSPEVLDRYKFHKNCERELHAITSPRIKKLIETKNIQLTTFSAL